MNNHQWNYAQNLYFLVQENALEMSAKCWPFCCGLSVLYSETTWAVGIAQLTHHKVQGGGKNPETGGQGIFCPHRTADRGPRWVPPVSGFCPHLEPRGELIVQYRLPMSFCFYPTLYLGNHLYFLSLWQFLKTAKEYIILGDDPLN